MAPTVFVQAIFPVMFCYCIVEPYVKWDLRGGSNNDLSFSSIFEAFHSSFWHQCQGGGCLSVWVSSSEGCYQMKNRPFEGGFEATTGIYHLISLPRLTYRNGLPRRWTYVPRSSLLLHLPPVNGNLALRCRTDCNGLTFSFKILFVPF